MVLRLRDLTAEELAAIRRLAASRTAPARAVERARIIWLAHRGRPTPAIARELRLCGPTVRLWIHRFNAAGLAGLRDRPRRGRPPTYATERVGRVVALALSDPDALDLPFGCWTLDRLELYLNEVEGIPIKRSRIAEVLRAEGLRWRTQETWFGERVDPAFAEKRGPSSRSTRPRRMAPPSSASTSWVRSRPRASRADGRPPSGRARSAGAEGGPSRPPTTVGAARATSSAPSCRRPARP
jgi:transposase